MHWPGSDLAILALVGFFLVVTLRRPVHATPSRRRRRDRRRDRPPRRGARAFGHFWWDFLIGDTPSSPGDGDHPLAYLLAEHVVADRGPRCSRPRFSCSAPTGAGPGPRALVPLATWPAARSTTGPTAASEAPWRPGSSGLFAAAGPARVRSGRSSTAPTRKQIAPTNVPRLVSARSRPDRRWA